MEKDFKRSEGVYLVPEYYAGTLLYKIERVNGDCSVSSLGCTIDEAMSLMKQLQEIFNGT